MDDTSATYWKYLRLEELLALQTGLADEASLQPDEFHFIIVHQVFELWFKSIIHELNVARDQLSASSVPEERIPFVVHHLRRINEVLNQAIDHFDVVETIDPQDFLDFRDKLAPASGFQSYQYREIEILLGVEENPPPNYGRWIRDLERSANVMPEAQRIKERIDDTRSCPSLLTSLRRWLYRTPIDWSYPDDQGDGAIVGAFIERYIEASESLQKRVLEAQGSDIEARRLLVASHMENVRRFLSAESEPAQERSETMRVRAALLFIESYRELPLLAWPRALIDTVVVLEERWLLWKQRHARMVERIIGHRVGTGGTSGVSYLEPPNEYRIFADLWQIRSILLPKTDRPELANRDRYFDLSSAERV